MVFFLKNLFFYTIMNIPIRLDILLLFMLGLLFLGGYGFSLYRRNRLELEVLHSSEERFKKMTSIIIDAIILADTCSRITFVNRAAVKMFGYREDELLGKEMGLLFVSPDDELGCNGNYITTNISECDSSLSLVGKRKDGRKFPVEISMSVMQMDKQWFSVGIIRDTTMRIRAEKDRQQLERQIQHTRNLESMGVLAGGLAHDFNNKLMIIQNAAELAMMGLPDDSDIYRDLDEIIRTVVETANLCSQMLAYSGQGKYKVRNLDLNKLVHKAVLQGQNSLSLRIHFACNYSEDILWVNGDSKQIVQVFVNIITNAVESITGDKGEIVISTKILTREHSFKFNSVEDLAMPAGNYALVKVCDNGCGIDKDELGKIFNPFFTTKFTGRGLGLAAVHGIVVNHHGSVNCSSEVGVGSEMSVIFPLLDSNFVGRTGNTDIELKSGSGNKTPHILLVDDNAEVLRIGKALLEHLGYMVYAADTGEKSLQLFSDCHNHIELVIVDVMMPDMRGDQVYSVMKELKPDVNFAFASGYSREDLLKRYDIDLDVMFIQKPYTINSLREKLAEFFDK